MSKVGQWFKRRFKELDHLEEYFPLLFTRWQAAIWGGSVLAVAFGWHFITADWPYPVKLGACVVALFFAGYYVWRADHVRLIPKFEITQVVRQTWTDLTTQQPAYGYYFEVVNTSEVESILEAKVQLMEIAPEVNDIKWLPVLLRQKHDNVHATHAAKTFDLNPGDKKHIDFVNALYGSNQFGIQHLVAGATNAVSASEHHRLKVAVTGKDTPSCYAWFEVWIDGKGVLQCKMEAKPKNSTP